MPTKAKPSDTRDLLILGGGLVGMTLALAAATIQEEDEYDEDDEDDDFD